MKEHICSNKRREWLKGSAAAVYKNGSREPFAKSLLCHFLDNFPVLTSRFICKTRVWFPFVEQWIRRQQMAGSTVAAYTDSRVVELAVWISTITTSIMWRPPCLLFVITRFILKRRRKKIRAFSCAEISYIRP